MEVADHSADVTTEAQGIAEQIPDDRGHTHGDIALDHDGEDVLASDEPSVEERQAWGHEHDEAGA